MPQRLLFICKQRLDSYGVSYGLVNSASFVAKTMREHGIAAKVVMATDANQIDSLVFRYNPTHVFIEAIWVTEQKFQELLKMPRHCGRQWIVRIHSKAPFIANEGVAMERLIQYRSLQYRFRNFHVSCNALEFKNSLEQTIFNSPVYLPNIYNPPRYPERCHEHAKKECSCVDIGCFGSLRPMKNQLNQALAAILFAEKMGKKLRFHINGDRSEQQGDQVGKNLRALFNGTSHLLVEHPWMDHDNFIQIVSKMDIGMQVSLSESFNIVAGDFVSQDIPIVVSPEIDWMPWIYQADPNSANSMVRKLKIAYWGKMIGLQELSYMALQRWNHKATKTWLKFVKDGATF